MAECNLCGAPVLWARTKPAEGRKGSSVPLDAQPVPNGNCWFEGTGKGRGVVFAAKDRPRPRGAKLWRSHFIDCEGYRAKKRLERLLKDEPECTCRPDACEPECGACELLELGVPCKALGVPGS